MELGRRERKLAERLGVALLDGVGTAPTRVDITSRRVVHVRRSLSPAEIAGIDPAWLAIEPTDRAGGSEDGPLAEWAEERRRMF